jgi:prepilin-type N-terminal cleavage/methylation domain-containing protein
MMRRVLGARWNGERGFTLAEVLIATFVLVIGLVAVMTGFQYAASGVETGKGETQALFFTEQRIEFLKNLALTNWASACLGAGTTNETSSTSVAACTPSPPSGNYRRDTTITDNPGAPCATNCKRVTVSVFYKPITGRGDLSQERRVDVVVLLVPRT